MHNWQKRHIMNYPESLVEKWGGDVMYPSIDLGVLLLVIVLVIALAILFG
jgi:hypothetical protein